VNANHLQNKSLNSLVNIRASKPLRDGLSNKEIARSLRIGSATVKNHVHSILTKLQVTSRGQAAAALHRDNLPVNAAERLR
jgi:FixJ family two-component response regulator